MSLGKKDAVQQAVCELQEAVQLTSVEEQECV